MATLKGIAPADEATVTAADAVIVITGLQAADEGEEGIGAGDRVTRLVDDPTAHDPPVPDAQDHVVAARVAGFGLDGYGFALAAAKPWMAGDTTLVLVASAATVSASTRVFRSFS